MNIVQTRGGPRDAGPPSVESLSGQLNVGIDLTLAPNVMNKATSFNLVGLVLAHFTPNRLKS